MIVWENLVTIWLKIVLFFKETTFNRGNTLNNPLVSRQHRYLHMCNFIALFQNQLQTYKTRKVKQNKLKLKLKLAKSKKCTSFKLSHFARVEKHVGAMHAKQNTLMFLTSQNQPNGMHNVNYKNQKRKTANVKGDRNWIVSFFWCDGIS